MTAPLNDILRADAATLAAQIAAKELSSVEITQACLDQCSFNSSPLVPPMVNAGEPGAPLNSDLSASGGFINFANGWTQAALQNYDPWSGAPFGSAGVVADDLTDAELDTLVCP